MTQSAAGKRAGSVGWVPQLMLAFCAGIFLYVATIGFRDPLFEEGGFRQTQTAISTDYLIRDGFRLAYETPVLGAPWSVPFEFPTYQFAVAILVKATGLPLDWAGRGVSVAFAAITFGLLFVFIRQVTGSSVGAVFAVCLALVTPVYLYFSRAFMIESTALCFALGLLIATASFIHRPRWGGLGWMLAMGLLAGPTKATTYAIALVAMAALLLFSASTLWERLRATGQPKRLAAGLIVALTLPFLATLAWTAWTDAVKSHNELAAFLTSNSLHRWNFGTAAQRADMTVWRDMGRMMSECVIGRPKLWLLIAIPAAAAVLVRARSRQRRGLGVLVAGGLAAFAAGPVVFLNLYYIHPYYYYADGIYLMAATGALLGIVWEEHGFPVKVCVVIAVLGLITVNVQAYTLRFYYQQVRPNYALTKLANKISELTPEGSVLLIDGADWDSSIAYYSRRRAIMNREMRATDDPQLQRAFGRLEKPVAAVIAVGGARGAPDFLAKQFAGLGRTFTRAYTSEIGDIYLPVDQPHQPSAIHSGARLFDTPARVAASQNLARSPGTPTAHPAPPIAN